MSGIQVSMATNMSRPVSGLGMFGKKTQHVRGSPGKGRPLANPNCAVLPSELGTSTTWWKILALSAGNRTTSFHT